MAIPRLIAAAGVWLLASTAAAQNTCPCPPEPKPGWRGSLGAGLALTRGNSDTRSYNVTLAAVYDPINRSVVRIDGLYLKSSTDGVNTVDRSALGLRYEHKLGGRIFAFGDVRHQRDTLKQLSSLLATTAGVGFKMIDTKTVAFAADVGGGFLREKLEDREATTSGALRTSETLTWKISPSGTLGHSFAALWKTDDFADAFYHVDVSLTASLANRLELKLAALSDTKNKPAGPTLKKRDDALIAAIVFKLR